jgi:acetate---CoA ligase (ADP-forming)
MRHAAGSPAGYPYHRAVDVGLRDGSTVHIRPALPTDLDRVVDFFEGLSDESVMRRFHGYHRPSRKELRNYVEVDYHHFFSLVAETKQEGQPTLLGIATFVRSGDKQAEIAIAVADSWQGKGIGSILVDHLCEAAEEDGIRVFLAAILSGNTEMLDVVRSLKLPVTMKSSMGVVDAVFPTSFSPIAIEAFEQREAVAAAAAVKAFIEPRSVAVVGASRHRGTVSGEVFHNLLDGGFEGPVYPVNPNAPVVQSVRAYGSITEVPDSVDLAVIVVPAERTLGVAQECADKGVRALLVISSGFAEAGDDGAARQRALLDIARGQGMRVVGPNCIGLINTDPKIKLNATFSPISPLRGQLAFSSQSGALGIAIIDRARELGLGMSSFVSVGNKADISGNDLLQYWEQDDATDVILLYLESFGNPRKFVRIARRIARAKPIVAVKSGRSVAGARAAASHTGSIVAEDVAVDALFHQAGVIRTDTLEQLFDVASLLATQPLPRGKRVAILTNAGGLGILCADTCEASGLEVPEIGADTRKALGELLPDEAGLANPIDLIASATPHHYGEAVRLLGKDQNIDSIIVIFIPPLVTRAEDVAEALAQAATNARDKTILGCFLGVPGIHERLRSGEILIPSFSFPEAAAQALGKIAKYAEWRVTPIGDGLGPSGTDRPKAVDLAARLVKEGDRWLEPAAVSQLLACYGIKAAVSRTAKDAHAVARATAGIGRPVAVKIDSRTITHKTDVGGVRLNLETPEAARTAAMEMLSSLEDQGLGHEVSGFLVQEMVNEEGAEMFVGMTLDPLFGPLIACGAGGTMVELLRDVSVRITPLTTADAREMLRSLRTFPLFEGYRGHAPLDAGALEEVLLRVSQMVEDIPQLSEIDLNPVLVSNQGCVVIDARMRIASSKPLPPRGARTVATP